MTFAGDDIFKDIIIPARKPVGVVFYPVFGIRVGYPRDIDEKQRVGRGLVHMDYLFAETVYIHGDASL